MTSRHLPILLAAVVCGAALSAQAPRPKPKPVPAEPAKPAPAAREPAQKPAAAATLLVVADIAATISIDGKSVGQLQEGETRQVAIGRGQHFVRADAGEDRWETVVEVKDATQLVLRTQVGDVRRARLDAARKADEAARAAEAEKTKREEAARKARMTPEGAAREIAAGGLERMGGLERLQTITTMVMNGRKGDASYANYYERPNRVRTNIESRYSDGKPMLLANGYDGTRTWSWSLGGGFDEVTVLVDAALRKSFSQTFPFILESVVGANGPSVRKADAASVEIVTSDTSWRLTI